MVKAVTASRRVFMLLFWVVPLVLSLALITIVANLKDAAAVNNATPKLYETWIPTANTALHFTATGGSSTAPPVVVQVTSIVTGFDTSRFYYRVYQPNSVNFVQFPVDEVSLTNGGYTAIITATQIPLYGTGEQVQFAVFYSGGDLPGAVTYPVTVTYSSFLPEVYNSYPALVSQGYSPCDAIPANPLTAYSIVQDASYRFFSMTVPTTSTVYMSVTNYTVSGQMQFRTPPPVGSCAPTDGSIINYTVIGTDPTIQAYNIPPGGYLARFSADTVTSTVPFTFTWNYSPGTGLHEPNNDFCSATPVNIGTQYPDYPEDNYDFFAFSNPTNQNLYISLANYTGSGGQMDLVQQTTNCSDLGGMNILQIADLNGKSSGVLTQTNAPAGQYYLMVYTGGNFNVTTPYNFQILTSSDVWNPQIDLCAAFTGCSDHTPNPDYSETVYWRYAPGATEIDVNFNGQATSSCPAGTNRSDVINSSTNPSVGSLTPSGSKTYSSLATGYYVVDVRIKRPGYPDGHDQKPLKVNCDPPYSLLQLWPNLMPTPTATAIGPYQSTAPVITPVPLPTLVPETKATPAP